ncbi:hypothetical protein [Methanococcoides sp. AM1]|uniref:hypothetical protein n=1 Tax=Methanococcoides sp. AM1 TaxID=1201011 RepID=UPI0010829E4F|nr:hypothetical protein [Methanococcoides sp. AM1]
MDISAIKRYAKKREKGDAAGVTTVIIRCAAILIIGIIVMNSIVKSASLQEGESLYNLSQSVIATIGSGYALSALLIISLGATIVMRSMEIL